MKTRITALAAAVAALPLLASAQSAADLQSQVEALLQQVQALQSQLGAQGGTSAGASTAAQGISGLAQQTGVKVIDSSACPQIGRTLKLTSTGDDVSRLQQFLARDRAIYPEGLVSGYYGSLTEAAVKRWQAKFNIVSSGTAESTGYGVVGPRTAAAISLQCSLYAGGGAGGGSGTVGGYIQVSPIAGNAPLSVNVQATVNTTNSCSGATYLLNWGDNSPVQQILVAAQQCNQVSQTYTHVYQYGGTYQISLMAGNHRTNATVTVFGPSAPAGYIGAGVSGGGIVTQTVQSSLPPESIGANTTTGPSPLTVTFTGVVTSADQGWCTGGCSSQLVFGDGQSASVPLPTAANTYQNYSITHTYTATGQYVATLYQGQQSAGRAVGSVNITVSQGQASSGSYGPFNVNPSASNPLSITASFQLPSSCTGYDLSWGDGSAHITQADGGSSCAQTATTQTFAHLYATSGTYSITLKRGPSLGVTDTATVSISN
jgi:peptidoglycan hydrolase-like protein with peptidoglycan-binding domain